MPCELLRAHFKSIFTLKSTDHFNSRVDVEIRLEFEKIKRSLRLGGRGIQSAEVTKIDGTHVEVHEK